MQQKIINDTFYWLKSARDSFVLVQSNYKVLNEVVFTEFPYKSGFNVSESDVCLWTVKKKQTKQYVISDVRPDDIDRDTLYYNLNGERRMAFIFYDEARQPYFFWMDDNEGIHLQYIIPENQTETITINLNIKKS